MCNLLGAALDAAVARVLDLSFIETPHGAVLLKDEGVFFEPSTNGHTAMQLQAQHDIAVYPDPDADGVGAEKWVAGFNIRADSDTDCYESMGPESGWLDMDHAARGTTPAIAICRALVVRGEAHAAAVAQHIAEQADRNERARQQAVFFEAHTRAADMIFNRVPTTEFETDEARQAYNALLEAHRNPDSVKTLPAWLKQFFVKDQS